MVYRVRDSFRENESRSWKLLFRKESLLLSSIFRLYGEIFPCSSNTLREIVSSGWAEIWNWYIYRNEYNISTVLLFYMVEEKSPRPTNTYRNYFQDRIASSKVSIGRANLLLENYFFTWKAAILRYIFPSFRVNKHGRLSPFITLHLYTFYESLFSACKWGVFPRDARTPSSTFSPHFPTDSRRGTYLVFPMR